jgi:hypothetical protein
MGRDAKGWPDSRIFERITLPWILRAVAAKAE